MKVVYFNYLFDKKESSVGAAVHVREFVRAARECEVEIKAYDMNRFAGVEEAEKSKSRAWLKKRLSRYLNQFNTLISNIGYFRREWRIVSEEKPDAILVRYNLLNFSAALVARLKRIPLVLEVNSPMALENKRFNKNGFHLPFFPERVEKLNLMSAKRVITVSQVLKDYFTDWGVPPERMQVVANGVDIETFRPDVDSDAVRRQNGFDGKIVLGFVGSFHYWHGVDLLEELVQGLSTRFPEVRFLLVGNGPLREKLEKSFQQKGLTELVAFTGYVPHEKVPEYIAAMDVVIAPYPQMEFFYFSPLKLFEYMATGKPVVASRIGQISEIIVDNENGMLFEAGDLHDLIQKSARLIENKDLREKIGKQARQSIEEKYSWKVNAKQILQVIGQSLNGHAGS